MNKDDLKENDFYPDSDKKRNKPPLEHEVNKKGQRQGGIDKKGEKEKDKKGEF